ncbi:hypothetical protein V2G26_016780 [Clonostachys chloroleuca]
MELGRLGPMAAFPGYPYDLPIASWEMPRGKGTLFRDRQRGEGSVLTALPRDLAAMYMHGLVMGLACLFCGGGQAGDKRRVADGTRCTRLWGWISSPRYFSRQVHSEVCTWSKIDDAPPAL